MKSGPSKVAVPTIIVATSPFTNVILGEDDYLNATLEQVNANTYDRLKMCRTTMTVDGGVPAMPGMGVIVSCTGAFLFPRMQGIDKQTVIDPVNKVLLRLMFGGIRFDAVSPDDVGHGVIYGTEYFMASGGGAGANYRFLMALQHQAASNFETIQLIDPRTYTKKQITGALSRGMSVAAKLPEINASMFLDGITHYQQLQLASALVFLWSTAESVLGRMWSEKVVPRGRGIVGRKRFVESNSWQTAYKVEVMFQLGTISESLHGKLNEARIASNT